MSPGPELDPRFDRQVRFAPLGARGQARLAEARVLLVGCGALGGVAAQNLHRAGVGELRIVDRDFVELSNLPRQVLFDLAQAEAGLPKVLAAAASLARAGGPTRVVPHALHLSAANLPELADGVDLILDGTDNLATRYLINDYAVEQGLPWIYAGVVGSGGVVLPVLPGVGACLRCIFPEAPPPGSLPSCDTAGVIAPAVGVIASLQAGLALRMLGGDEPPEPALFQLDVWHGSLLRAEAPRRADCPTCARREFPFLDAGADREPVLLCGRNTVQVQGGGARPDLAAVERSLAGVATGVRSLGALLRFDVEELRVTLFADGRALIEGTEDTDRARAVYDRYVGS